MAIQPQKVDLVTNIIMATNHHSTRLTKDVDSGNNYSCLRRGGLGGGVGEAVAGS